MSKSPAGRAWTDLNSLLRTHKLINVAAILVCLLQGFIILAILFADPIVVIDDGTQQKYYVGKRFTPEISEQVVEQFVSDFLTIRYQWQQLDPDSMSKSLAPIVTEGLGKKLHQLMVHLKEKEFQEKDISQSIVNIDVSVTKEKVIASFDKLLRVEGVPIPVPTTVSLNIIKGGANAWNPIGLYVNGIREHQSR